MPEPSSAASPTTLLPSTLCPSHGLGYFVNACLPVRACFLYFVGLSLALPWLAPIRTTSSPFERLRFFLDAFTSSGSVPSASPEVVPASPFFSLSLSCGGLPAEGPSPVASSPFFPPLHWSRAPQLFILYDHVVSTLCSGLARSCQCLLAGRLDELCCK